jgi:predicted membrane protein
MKMGAGLFWGIILIVIGLSIIFRVFFDISILRIVFAVAIILVGIKILIGKPKIHISHKENQVLFGERSYRTTSVDQTEYNTIFGKSVYDFRDIKKLDTGKNRIEVNTVFGSTELILPDSVPVRIKADAAFAAAQMPNGNSVAFGTINYNNEIADSASDYLYIEANVVFGDLKVRN